MNRERLKRIRDLAQGQSGAIGAFCRKAGDREFVLDPEAFWCLLVELRNDAREIQVLVSKELREV